MICRGSISVVSRAHLKQRAYFYGYVRNWRQGRRCPNDLMLPID